MGWREALGLSTPAEPAPAPAQDMLPWDDVLTKYDVVDVEPNNGHPYVIVTDRINLPEVDQPKLFKETRADATIGELGSASPSPFTSSIRAEYNNELRGVNGLQKYDRMRKSDGTVRGTLRLVKTPVLAARWFIESASDSKLDENKADFAWKCLTEYMSISWPQVLTESLLMAEFGYYMFEKVWEERMIEGKNRMVLKKLAPRHPMDVKRWVFDANGGPRGVIMYGNGAAGSGPVQPIYVNGQIADGGNAFQHNLENGDIWIPIDKLLVFTFDREAGNIEGISVLRSAYKHWYYKEQLYKIDAIQKERHGIGIPIIKLPPGFTRDDKTAANELGRNLRTNERAHVVLPPNWEILFAKLEGHIVNALDSAEHHNDMIRENVLAGFLGPNNNTKEEDQIMFLKATRFIADIVCETYNNYLMPQLIDYNFERGTSYPKLKARRIGESADWRTLSFAIRNLIGAKVITPDEKLEDWIREEMDLPKRDPESIRVLPTPQAPGADPNAQGQPGQQQGQPGEQKQNSNKNQVGLPRQTPTPPVGTPKGNAGKDASGGK